jgi:hypothetical protein
MVSATERAEARHSGLHTICLPEPMRVSATVAPKLPSAKGTSYAHCNGVKALRVAVMAAQQEAKRLDLVSYTLAFLIVVVAAEAILVALIW